MPKELETPSSVHQSSFLIHSSATFRAGSISARQAAGHFETTQINTPKCTKCVFGDQNQFKIRTIKAPSEGFLSQGSSLAVSPNLFPGEQITL